jgi:hypothetical protein
LMLPWRCSRRSEVTWYVTIFCFMFTFSYHKIENVLIVKFWMRMFVKNKNKLVHNNVLKLKWQTFICSGTVIYFQIIFKIYQNYK